MSKIYVDFDRLQKIGEGCGTVSSKTDGIKKDFQQTIRKLDWDVRFQSDINSTAMQLSRKLQNYHRVLKEYKAFVELAHKKYLELDSVDFELKFEAGQTNIFNGENGYGGDQGDMSHNRNGFKFLWWVWGEDKDIYDFVRTQEGYANYSETQIHELLDKINSEGCGYVALVNTLFLEFPGSEAEFEQIYGFPMRDKDGNYNFNQMLIDIYCKTDDKYFLTEDSGKNALICDVLGDYQDNPAKFEKDYGVKYDPNSETIPDEVSNAILARYDGEVASYKAEGTTIYSQENRLLAYLHEKGIDANVNCSSSSTMSVDSVKNTLESGTVVKLSLGKGTQFCDENGKVQQTLGGGHAVLITGVTDDGRYIISSWGNQYYVDPSQTYTDPKSGESSLVINSYLTLDVIYK